MERKTAEVGPSLPEQLVFSPLEAEFCIKALHWRLAEKLREHNVSMSGSLGDSCFLASLDHARTGIQNVFDTVGQYAELSVRMFDVWKGVDAPVELSVRQIDVLGSALADFGINGLRDADEAIDFRFRSADDENKAAKVGTAYTASGARDLYQQLDPIARSKEGIVWQTWTEYEDGDYLV